MKSLMFFFFLGLLAIPGLAKPKDKLNVPSDVAMAMRQLPAVLDFNIDVKPILSDKCFACHGPDKAKQKAGLRLDQAENAYATLPESPGKFAIVRGDISNSELVHRILSKDPKYVMPVPKSHLDLSAKEKAVLVKWIQNGAEYKPHWAFVKPVKNEIPTGQRAVDYFVQSKLTSIGLGLSARANRNFLLRRLSFDLTGLPPTPQEIHNFVADTSPEAYEKQVDRLLTSPHFGERMAADWLDIARFADSHGYTIDRIRDMSPYRDWVIQAFNQNMSYDRFIHYQIAGDLMPNPTKDMLIATAFNRNHPQNTEGGIVEEEFQMEYVLDRVNTFGDAFLGLSTGCARCHDHKFDPISQKNYYQLSSFFNTVREAGQISYNDDMPSPTMLLPTAKQEEVLTFIKSNIQTAEEKWRSHQVSTDSQKAWLASVEAQELMSAKSPSKRGLLAHYSFEGALASAIQAKDLGIMKRESGKMGDIPVFVSGKQGSGLAFDGDVYVDFQGMGVFRKSDPFTIGMWVNIPKDLKEGVIFHKSNAERLYNFKGFHVYLKNNRLEIMMAHTAPSNAITKITEADVPRDTWIHVALSYDGSSRAEGFHLYMNGQKAEMETLVDALDKDIIFYSKQEPGLQIGGWWRGLGFKGGKADEVYVYNRALRPYELALLASKQPAVDPLDFYVQVVDSLRQVRADELRHWRKALSDSTEKIQELMVMREMKFPKKTFVLKRGVYDAPGEEVFPNTPEKIMPFPTHLPKNRLGLARWLTDSKNPLTARVVVNRFWQQLFGQGIVKTSEDFGNQGEMPVNLALLDYLALKFQENGWNVKALLKEMVMSETYQQDSKTSPELREKDPENRFLARGPSARLSAEMMRDNALVASGLLNPRIGGKSIYPYQPEGLWEINSHSYKADTTQEIYRRSLYVVVKRSVPNPTLATFDASARSSCLPRRQKTTTPLQALVLMNDPTFVEACKVLGFQMAQAKSAQEAIKDAYLRVTGREIKAEELAILQQLQAKEIANFASKGQKMKGLLAAGRYKIPQEVDPAKVASYAVVASVIMNSDASITKR
jgi:hypothetical protein